MRIVVMEDENMWYQVAMYDMDSDKMEMQPLRFNTLTKAIMAKVALEQNDDGVSCEVFQIKRMYEG